MSYNVASHLRQSLITTIVALLYSPGQLDDNVLTLFCAKQEMKLADRVSVTENKCDLIGAHNQITMRRSSYRMPTMNI